MSKERRGNLNQHLKDERLRQGWSQQEVAERLGATPNTISRWELGVTTPNPYFRAKLSALFGKTAQELGLLADRRRAESESSTRNSQAVPASLDMPASLFWTVPFRRNPFFTGREEVIHYLAEALHSHKNVALTQAISGLGGIGKTQTAIEYAYRYRENYQAVLWVHAYTQQALLASIVALAEAMRIIEPQQEHDQNRIVAIMQRWLREHDRWLLIVDNVEDMHMVSAVLPFLHCGHVLLTTRSQITGTLAHSLSLTMMTPQEGTLFLLHRAKRLDPTARLEEAEEGERACAMEVVDLMGALPLALDQAAAYLEETGCSLHDYRDAYLAHRAILLGLRGSGIADHPVSVMATFALALGQVEQADPVAAEILRFCAFLHPDAIPEDLITAAASELGPVLQLVGADPFELNRAISTLRRFSLLSRHSEAKTLTIHRLVQAVLRDRMDEMTQHTWAELTVQAVNRVFPEADDETIWPKCQRYLPHALACWHLIEQWQITSEAARRLLHQAGEYLVNRGQYEQAERLLLEAHRLHVLSVGMEHPDSVASLNSLGGLRFYQGHYGEAEQLFQQALALRERIFPPEHPEVLESVSDLAVTYQEQGQYAEAEPLFQRILERKEQALGPLHPAVASALRNLAILSRQQGKYDKAFAHLTRALHIFEQIHGVTHLDVAFCLEHLGLLSRDQGQDEAALQHLQRALTIREQVLGSEDHHTATSLYLLGSHYRKLGRYQEAFPLLSHALSIRQQVLGSAHCVTSLSLQSLGVYYLEQGEPVQAKLFLQQALTIQEQELGPQHPVVAQSYADLARLYTFEGHYAEAEPLFQRALSIWERVLGCNHPTLVTCLEQYAELLRKVGRTKQATTCEARARQVRATRPECLPTNAASRDERAESDDHRKTSFADFLAACCYMHPQAWSRAGDLWRAYEQWAQEQREVKPLSRRAFVQLLTTQGCQATRTNTDRLWRGIALRSRQGQGDVE